MFQNKQNKHGKYQCPCCGYYTFNESVENTFSICRVCYWEDDGVQLRDPDYEGGANVPSLNQSRENFKRYGAMEERFIHLVEKPSPDELE